MTTPNCVDLAIKVIALEKKYLELTDMTSRMADYTEFSDKVFNIIQENIYCYDSMFKSISSGSVKSPEALQSIASTLCENLKAQVVEAASTNRRCKLDLQLFHNSIVKQQTEFMKLVQDLLEYAVLLTDRHAEKKTLNSNFKHTK